MLTQYLWHKRYILRIFMNLKNVTLLADGLLSIYRLTAMLTATLLLRIKSSKPAHCNHNTHPINYLTAHLHLGNGLCVFHPLLWSLSALFQDLFLHSVKILMLPQPYLPDVPSWPNQNSLKQLSVISYLLWVNKDRFFLKHRIILLKSFRFFQFKCRFKHSLLHPQLS